MIRYIIEQSGRFYWELHCGDRVTIKSEFAFDSRDAAMNNSEYWTGEYLDLRHLRLNGVEIEKTHFIKTEQK